MVSLFIFLLLFVKKCNIKVLHFLFICVVLTIIIDFFRLVLSFLGLLRSFWWHLMSKLAGSLPTKCVQRSSENRYLKSICMRQIVVIIVCNNYWSGLYMPFFAKPQCETVTYTALIFNETKNTFLPASDKAGCVDKEDVQIAIIKITVMGLCQRTVNSTLHLVIYNAFPPHTDKTSQHQFLRCKKH